MTELVQPGRRLDLGGQWREQAGPLAWVAATLGLYYSVSGNTERTEELLLMIVQKKGTFRKQQNGGVIFVVWCEQL